MPKKPKTILLVSGLSGAGKSTTLRTLEDMGWEVVDNLPLLLLDSLLDAPLPEGEDNPNRPLALGIDSRKRGFDPAGTVRRIQKLRASNGYDVATLFDDCAGAIGRASCRERVCQEGCISVFALHLKNKKKI